MRGEPPVYAQPDDGPAGGIPPEISAAAVRHARHRGILKWLLYTWRLSDERFPYATSIAAHLSVDPEDGARWVCFRVVAPEAVSQVPADYFGLERELARDLPADAEENLVIIREGVKAMEPRASRLVRELGGRGQ